MEPGFSLDTPQLQMFAIILLPFHLELCLLIEDLLKPYLASHFNQPSCPAVGFRWWRTLWQYPTTRLSVHV